MELMQANPTEKRLDDLNHKVDHGFARGGQQFTQLDQRLDRVEMELRALRTDMTSELIAVRKEMKAGFDRMEGRFDERSDAVYRLLVRFCGAALATLVGLIVSLLGFVATQV